MGQLFGGQGKKKCCCPDNTCCTGRCNPYISALLPGTCTGDPTDNPLPSELTVEMGSDSTYGCWSATATATLIEYGRWSGRLTATCTFCCPGSSAASCTWYFDFLFIIQCTADQGWGFEWDEVFAPSLPAPAIPPNFTLTKFSCNPVLLSGEVCYNPGMICAGLMPPIGTGENVVHPTLCLSIIVSETI